VKVEPLGLGGLLLIQLDVYADPRGFFTERYNQGRFADLGLPPFCQDNHSRSVPRTVRGLHYQVRPAQGKLVGVIRGEIWDVVVDIRPQSASFGETLNLRLNDRDGQLLWVPPGFAHGFCVTGSEAADVLYKVDSGYEPSTEGGILWSDPELAIDWPVTDPIISQKDLQLPTFERYRASPPEWPSL
jgi:dTDP-4-dehydrorhamnose 3,5-epimerase